MSWRVVALGVSIAVVVCAQEFKPLTGPAPRLAGGKPDLSGVWQKP